MKQSSGKMEIGKIEMSRRGSGGTADSPTLHTGLGPQKSLCQSVATRRPPPPLRRRGWRGPGFHPGHPLR